MKCKDLASHPSRPAVYWTTTGLIALVMVFSLFKMYSPAFGGLGFPGYFRTELVVAKLAGLIVLLVPGIPLRLKEWAYAGFAIVLVSASVAHLATGDTVVRSMEPLGFLAVLLVSNRALHGSRALHGQRGP